MATSGSPVSVVLIGLPANHAVIPEHLRPMLTKTLEEARAQFVDAGYLYEFIALSPDEELAVLGPKLQSLRPDAVVMGNGIRSKMELTHFMEQIIDTVRTAAPQAKLLFNTLPKDTIDAVKRWFPTPAKSS